MSDQYNRLSRSSLVIFGLLLGLFNTPLLVSMWWAGWIDTPQIIMRTIIAPVLVLVALVLLRAWMWMLKRRETKEGL